MKLNSAKLVEIYLDDFGAIDSVSDTFSYNLSRINDILKHGIMNSS